MNISNIVLAIKELGFQPVLLNILYRLGLMSGYFRLRTSAYPYTDKLVHIQLEKQGIYFIAGLLAAAEPDNAGRLQIIATADEITRGTIQLYGAIPTPIQFNHQPANSHWCNYETGRIKLESLDVKDIWEPTRFSWVFPLGQAYHLTHDEKYPICFWKQFESFLEMAPPNLGPHWMNGQEVALRLISFAFASQIFGKSPHSTSERETSLKAALAAHARRIMATLIYARSQRNNHLLSEAAGVYTAGLLLQGMPEAIKWKQTGWKLFIEGIRDQIAPDGSYIQQSTSYHRLMLHLAVWVQALSSFQGACVYPDDVRPKIILATRWLENLVLSDNGHVPNMGANDGANILPLGGGDVLDYRPVLQLAKNAFLSATTPIPASKDIQPEQMMIMKDGEQTACMRVARYRGRPSHADQLHLDLWWRNRNIALDAGTYRYNYPAPWENALAMTTYHNTITIDDCDQMIRAGRFLWLRRANIRNLVMQRDPQNHIRSTSAEHDGYRQLGITHKRTVESKPGGEPGWFIKDELLPYSRMKGIQPHTARLVWLLPDWEWELDHLMFCLHSPEGIIRLNFSINGADEKDIEVSVFRAGSALNPSNEIRPTWGWYSPTYGVKEPALALHVLARGNLPMQLITRWQLPK